MRRIIFAAALVFTALIISGCAEFDYTGRTFSPHNEETAIAWHTAQNPVPAGKFRVIGRGTLAFNGNRLDKYDIEERLLEEARKIGADAVMLKKTVSIEVTSFDIDHTFDTAKSAKAQKQTAVDLDGNELEINSFGKEKPLKGNEHNTFDTIVYAVFYKNSADIKKLIESQSVRMLGKDTDK